MIIVRVLTAVAKPALLGGTITASVAGGWFAFDRYTSGSPTPFAQAQSVGQRLIISEFSDKSDSIVAVDPGDVANGRTQIATIDHAFGYGVFPVLSPDGEAIAYTALPPDTQRASPDSPAQAAIVDTDGNVTALADDVDLIIPPVWSPDSASIVVRKSTPPDAGAPSNELLLLGRDDSRLSLTSWQTAAVFPIAFSRDASKLYFATLNNDGTDVYSVANDGTAETKIAHLSDQIARDWKLSPDGATLAYSVAESGARPAVVAKTLDLRSASESNAMAATNLEAGPPPVGAAQGEFNPAWRNDGSLTIASLKLDGGSDALARDARGSVSILTTNGDGIDLPVEWSPDGATLAVRAVDGRTPFDASASHIELLREGSRERVSDSADVLVVGWLP